MGSNYSPVSSGLWASSKGMSVFPLFLLPLVGWQKVYGSLLGSGLKPGDGSSGATFAVGTPEHVGGGEGEQSSMGPWKGR